MHECVASYLSVNVYINVSVQMHSSVHKFNCECVNTMETVSKPEIESDC